MERGNVTDKCLFQRQIRVTKPVIGSGPLHQIPVLKMEDSATQWISSYPVLTKPAVLSTR